MRPHPCFLIQTPFLLMALSAGLACQSQQWDGYSAGSATTLDADKAGQFLPMEEVLRLRAQQSQALDDYVIRLTRVPRVPDRPTDALAAIDEGVAKLAAIRQAEDMVINNLANAETTAHKAARPIFGHDGHTFTTRLDFTQGALETTNRPLDVAIEGDGFFKVKLMDKLGDGFGYTRNGNLFIDDHSRLVVGTGDGYEVTPAIRIPNDAAGISISRTGMIEYMRGPGDTKITAGQLKLTRFRNPESLKLLLGGIYVPSETAGAPIESVPGQNGCGSLLQGCLEGSNVDPIRERLYFIRLREWHEALLHTLILAAPPTQHTDANHGN